MKPKIFLAKYLDWVILAILALALIVVAVRSFVYKSGGDEQLRTDITSYDNTVRNAMTSRTVKPQPPPDYLSELRSRFEHPAVMDPYRYNPFLTREPIAWPQLLQLRVAEPYSVPVPVRFIQVVDPDPDRVKVQFSYDLLNGLSTATFTPLVEGETTVRMRTDEEQTYLFKINARTAPKLPPPNPPINVAVTPRAPTEVKRVLEPAMVLISFQPSDPRDISRTIGFSSNAAIYRKTEGAPDADYVRLDDPEHPLVPLSADQIDELWLKFHGAKGAAAPALEPPVPSPAGPVVPEPVQGVPTLEPSASAVAHAKPARGSFVFLDANVDDGETYIYKIITLSTSPGSAPVPCLHPYVSSACFVPPLVEFTVTSITGERAVFRLTRRDPDNGTLINVQGVTASVGQKIGGPVTVSLPLPIGAPPGTRPKTKQVDFSTGCVLVAAVPAFQTVEFAKVVMDRNLNMIYKAKLARDPVILYLTPRGALHVKSKEVSR